MDVHVINPVETTEDCKQQLNRLVGDKKWKRLYKLGDIRCFTNEDKEVVTIAESTYAAPTDEDEYDETEMVYCMFVGLDIKDDIKAIMNISKLYYTCDYGDVFYNPSKRILHIVGGDGGYCYSPTKLKKDADGEIDFSLYAPHTPANFKEFNTHPETAFITSVVWADEYFPEESGFISICKIRDFFE